MLRIVFGVFFIAHGLVHAILAFAPNPADPEAKPGSFFTARERSWLLHRIGLSGSAVQWIGIILVVLSTLGFVLAGLGIFGLTGLYMVWRTLAVISSCISLVLLILFWHPWLPVGVLIDIGTLVVLLLVRWPAASIIGP
jgi:hypothetical protein